MKITLSKVMRRIERALWTKKRRHILIWRPADVYIDKKAEITVDEYFAFNEPWRPKNRTLGRLSVYDTASVHVGNVHVRAGCKMSIHGSFTMKSGGINNDSKIVCKDRITIGEGVFISAEVVIWDTSEHHVFSLDDWTGSPVSEPITIGDHVLIGTRSIILKGVTIGNNAVIGAGSVVTHDIPAHCFAAGIPARVIKTNIDWVV